MEFYEWGKITHPHGIKGFVQIDTGLNDKRFVTQIRNVYLQDGSQYVARKVQSVMFKKTEVCILMEGCADRSAAESLSGRSVFLEKNRPPLPERINLVQDLIGCEVHGVQTDRVLGKLTGVESYPRHDIYIIKSENGFLLVPALMDVFPSIDSEGHIIYADERRFHETAFLQEGDQ